MEKPGSFAVCVCFHNYYVDLSQKLWDVKHGLLNKRTH